MSIRTPGRRRVRVAAVLSVALATVLAPTAAHASATPGGTRTDPVPMPVASLDGAFTASNVGVVSDAGPGQVRPNVAWYSLTPDRDARVEIRATSLEPDGWDNTLEVWDGDTLVDDNDDRYGLDAALTVDVEAGTTYLVGLGSFHRAGDHFEAHGTATLALATRVPSAPSGLSATPGDRSVTLTWLRPDDVAGGIDVYEVLCAPVGQAERVCATERGQDPPTTSTLRGLRNGQEYTFRVVARNLIGASEASPSVTATPRVPTTTTIAVDPEQLVAGQPFDVRVQVAQTPDPDSGTSATPQVSTRPADGTVDVTVGGTSRTDVPLVDGVAVVADVTAPGGAQTVTARYDGTDEAEASSATLTLDVARRADTVTLSVPDLRLGQQVRDVASSASGLPVTLSATGACTAADGVVTGTGAGACTVTASTAGDRDTQPATASTTVGVTVPAPALALDMDVRPGARAAGAPVTATGQGLRPGSEVTLVVHSTPRTIGTAVAAADGSAVVTGVLPAGLEAGAHRVVAHGTGFDGTPLSSELGFTLAADGTFLGPEGRSEVLAATGAEPAALATTGAEPAGAAATAAAWIALGAALLLVARRRVGRPRGAGAGG